MDLSAAFDVVDHSILIQKLQLYGFSNETVNWFKSYLENQYQHVMVESQLSGPILVGDQGVPQGSLLGPLCFLIFYNDFPATRNQGESVLYADDSTDNVSSSYPQDLQNILQTEADLSVAWVKDNRLVCSGNKTKLLVIGTQELRRSRLDSLNIKLSVKVDDHLVQESVSEKLLGMIINNKLTWSHHLHGDKENKGLISKLSQRAGLIRRLSQFMPQKQLKIVSNGIFFSLISYGLPIYGSVSGLFRYSDGHERYQSLSREDSHQIQVVINVVLRAITRLPKETPINVLVKQVAFYHFTRCALIPH